MHYKGGQQSFAHLHLSVQEQVPEDFCSPTHKEFADQCLSSSLLTREDWGKSYRKPFSECCHFRKNGKNSFLSFQHLTTCIFNLLSYRLAFVSALKMASCWATCLSVETETSSVLQWKWHVHKVIQDFSLPAKLILT